MVSCVQSRRAQSATPMRAIRQRGGGMVRNLTAGGLPRSRRDEWSPPFSQAGRTKACRVLYWSVGSSKEPDTILVAPFSFACLPFWAETSAPFLVDPESKRAGHRALRTGDRRMGKKLYVGNLSYDMTSSELEQLFAAARHRAERGGDHGPRPAGARASVSSKWVPIRKPRRPSRP